MDTFLDEQLHGDNDSKLSILHPKALKSKLILSSDMEPQTEISRKVRLSFTYKIIRIIA